MKKQGNIRKNASIPLFIRDRAIFNEKFSSKIFHFTKKISIEIAKILC